MDVLQSYCLNFVIFPQILFIYDAQISSGSAQMNFVWINLNKNPHLSTTQAKILIGRFICTSKD